MANIWKQGKEVNNHAKRNNFDLSFQNHLTMKMGQLYPVFCKEVVPGDSFRINSAFGLKFMPLAFPVQSKMRATMHFFYCRNKNLWDRWEDWIQGLKGTDDGVVHPYISQPSSFFKTGSLSDYLGIPTTLATSGNVGWRLPAYHGRVVDATANGTFFPFYSAGDEHVSFDTYNASNMSGFSACSQFYLTQQALTDYMPFSMAVSFVPDLSVPIGWLYGWSNAVLGGEEMSIPCTYQALSGPTGTFTAMILTRPSGEPSWSQWSIRSHYPLINNSQLGDDSWYFDTDNLRLKFRSAFINEWNNFVGQGLQCALLLAYDYSADILGKNSFYETTGYLGSYVMSCVNSQDVSDNIVSPFSIDADTMKISALPFRAYESVVRCYYKNSVLQPLMINGSPEYNKYNTTTASGADTTDYKLEKRNYELDFLTSALPSPQQGNAPLVGMSALGTITLQNEDGVTTAKAVLDNDGNITGVNLTSPIAGKEHALTLQQIASAGFSINDFRNTNALQRWLETNIRKGYRYIDFIAGHYGKSPEYRELDLPEFIGGFTQDVSVSQIVSSADTLGLDGANSGASLGSYNGMANCFGGSKHSVSHYCDDYGFIIGILCVVPTPSYSQLLPKHYLKYNPLDYYFPEFSEIGMQPITYEEVCPVQAYHQSVLDQGATSVHDTFGYQRPNYDMVASVDEIHGQFRHSLSGYLINRVFEERPQLGDDFLQIDPNETNQIFVDQAPDSDNIIGQVIFDVKAKRPIPRVHIPSLGH